MTDKKAFGSFIKSKRVENGYSQKELAEKLYVTEGAVSKWERGVSYPDITLISDICRILNVSEHELITALTDAETRKLQHEAKSFRNIRGAWFWIPTISYSVALLTCFICNLAVSGTLSWFFIVLSALVCAYTFIPTVSFFFKKQKLLAFTVTSFVSVCLLLLTCAIYTGGMFWLLTACIGVLMGYIQIFVPILLAKTKLSRYKFIISFASTFVLTVLLLLNIYTRHPFMLDSAILITCYAYIPALLCTIICALRFDAFLKTGICLSLSSIIYFFLGHFVNILFNTNENYYQVNFSDWAHYTQGNINFITLTSLLFISAIFIIIGILRVCKKK